MDSGELRARVADVRYWFHTIELPYGITTPGAGNVDYERGAADIYYGMGIEGRTVLDVGAWDGFFSFEAERRGAAQVLAVDDFVWRPGGPGDRCAFELAREALGSRVQDQQLDLPDITRDRLGQFDIVLYNGIVYHVLDPIHDLIEMARIARHVLTVETWIDNLDNPRAVMNFFPGEASPQGHPQNGWGPNSLLMHTLLKRIGFETVLEFPTPVWGDQRSIFLAFQPGHPFAAYVDQHKDRARPRFRGRAEDDTAREETQILRQEIATLRAQNRALLQSTSWRITAPIRALKQAVGR